jgi:RNA polymerase sigma-70 factor, ECF subfamily
MSQLLAQRIVRGDETAVRELVRRVLADREAGKRSSSVLAAVCSAFREQIVRYLRGRYFRGDPEAAREVWNDTLVAVFKSIHKFDPARATFKTWLFNHANWAAQKWTRQRERERRGDRFAAPGRQRDSQPEPHLLSLEETEAMRRAFATMSDREQRLLFLRHVFGCRHAEIARSRLGETADEAAVRVYVHRATAKLRQRFEAERSRGDVPSPAPDPDELVSIAELVRSLDEAEMESLACLEADLEAARLGRMIRASLLGTKLANRVADAEGEALPARDGRNSVWLTDEEVAHALSSARE